MRIALKGKFSTLKIYDWDLIYLQGDFAIFTRVLLSQTFVSAKFRENKTLTKFMNLQYNITSFHIVTTWNYVALI